MKASWGYLLRHGGVICYFSVFDVHLSGCLVALFSTLVAFLKNCV